ncbi:MAG: iron ABC transporter permease [Tissierellia bacterium]|nr:iron ABC transporter permease [Tissierellia bacterium]
MKKFWFWLVLLSVLLVISFVLGVNLGYAKIPLSQVMSIIGHHLGINMSMDGIKDSTIDIITYIRVPRLILAVIVGMSLATSGVVMQAVVRNPLADPFVLGVSSGAALGATLAILFGLGKFVGPNSVGFVAFLMAFLVAMLVVFLANLGGRATSTKLLLSGLALSTVASSFSNLLIYLSPNRDAARQVTFWMLGSLAGAKWNQITFIGPIILICSLFFLVQYRTLNLMLLGDEVSITLGKDLNKSRHIFILVSSALIGFVVYVSGVLGFVGLIVPHIARILIGTDHKKLIPISMLLGSLLLLWADVISRILIPGSELPTGVIISIVGAPLFIYLIIKRTYGGRK